MSNRSRKEKSLDREIPSVQAPAVLFDLDGTLMDSNYEHVISWRLAFRRAGFEVPNAFLHRCIGMRGDLLVRAVIKEIRASGRQDRKKLEKLHKGYFLKSLSATRPLPGAVPLLKTLSHQKVPWAIATGGDKQTVAKMIRPFSVLPSIPVITADDVAQAKPEPDVFLVAAQHLRVAFSDCIVVGDSVWDLLGARRAKALGIGLRSGGYSEAELLQAGAYRVYRDPADLLDHLSEIGIDPR